MVRAQDPLAVGQGPLVQRDRLGGPARGLVGEGEVVPGGQGVGVVRAQDPLAVGQGPLVQRDRLGGPARVPVGDGEVVPGGQGVGVVRAQDPLAVGQGPLVQRDRLGGPARGPVGEARLFREARVSGWSGPRTRSRSARVRSCSGIASAARPAAW